MSHKVHPKIFRIREIKDWLSRGFYQGNIARYLREDFLIRRFLKERLKTASIEDIEIERSPSVLKIIIKTSRPALVIGRGGKEIEEIKKSIESIIAETRKEQTKFDFNIKIEVLEVKNPWANAKLLSQWVASQIEKKVPYRRVLKMGLSKAKENKNVKGVKISVAGRLNGVEISRREWLKEGSLPRHTIRAIMDYGFSEARCKYGVIGVKVWIYKGDRFKNN